MVRTWRRALPESSARIDGAPVVTGLGWSQCSRSRSRVRARSDPAWVGRGSTTRAGSWSRRRATSPSATSPRLLLDADAEVLRDTRNAQLTTFVSSLMVLDAVERLGIEPSFCAGHSLGEYTALDGHRRPRRSTTACASSSPVPTPCTRPGWPSRGRWPPCSASTTTRSRSPAAAPTRTCGWPTTTRPGQVVIAGSPEGVAAATDPRQGAGGQEGDAAAGVGRVPHPVHDGGPQPAAAGDRGRPIPATPRSR